MVRQSKRPVDKMLRTVTDYATKGWSLDSLSPTYRADRILELIQRIERVLANGSYPNEDCEVVRKKMWKAYEFVQSRCDATGDYDDERGRVIYMGDGFTDLVDQVYVDSLDYSDEN